MAKIREPELVPFFGCGAFVPPPPPVKGQKVRCHICGSSDGRGRKDSDVVCMGCHAVAPEHEAAMGLARAEAVRNREIERRQIEIAAAAIRAGRASSLERGSRVLTLAERQDLISENRDLADLTHQWLESIGQPLDGGDLAATVKMPAKPRVVAKTKIKRKKTATKRGVA